MGLDITVCGHDRDEEIDGCRVGSSDDFDQFRRTVSKRLDRRLRRTRFPSLLNADVWDGAWDRDQAAVLEAELNVIASEFAKLAHEPQPGDWQDAVRQECGLVPTSLLESFITLDGELLVLQMITFAQIAQRENGLVRLG